MSQDINLSACVHIPIYVQLVKAEATFSVDVLKFRINAWKLGLGRYIVRTIIIIYHPEMTTIIVHMIIDIYQIKSMMACLSDLLSSSNSSVSPSDNQIKQPYMELVVPFLKRVAGRILKMIWV